MNWSQCDSDLQAYQSRVYDLVGSCTDLISKLRNQYSKRHAQTGNYIEE